MVLTALETRAHRTAKLKSRTNIRKGGYMERQDFIYRVKIDNHVIDNMLESDNKRALAMYAYFLF